MKRFLLTMLAAVFFVACSTVFVQGKDKGKGSQADENKVKKSEKQAEEKQSGESAKSDKEKEKQKGSRDAAKSGKSGGKNKGQEHQQQLKALDEQMASEQTRFSESKTKLEQEKAAAQQKGDTKAVERIDGLLAKEQKQYDQKKQQMDEKRQKLLELMQQESPKDANQPAKEKSKGKSKS